MIDIRILTEDVPDVLIPFLELPSVVLPMEVSLGETDGILDVIELETELDVSVGSVIALTTTFPFFAVQLLLEKGTQSPAIIANAQVSSLSVVPKILLWLKSSIFLARMMPSPTKLLLIKHESEIESVASNPTVMA
jgi:hypothetical protein